EGAAVAAGELRGDRFAVGGEDVVEAVVGFLRVLFGSGVVQDVLDHGELGRREVVVGDGAGLDVPGQDRAGAVGREAQRIGGSGIDRKSVVEGERVREGEGGGAHGDGEPGGDRAGVGGQ